MSTNGGGQGHRKRSETIRTRSETIRNEKNRPENFAEQIFGVKKSKIANRLKRVLPKFGADRSYVWEVNGRSKFVIAGRFVRIPCFFRL